MNLYLFERPHYKVDHDEFEGHVIRAANQQQAIDLLPDPHFLDQYEMKIIAAGVNGEPTIILSAFNAG